MALTPEEDQAAEDLVFVLWGLAQAEATEEQMAAMVLLTADLKREQLLITLFGILGLVGAAADGARP
jgi:hypothetical protein